MESYHCEVCDYIARDAYNMKKHIETRKHLQMCSVAGITHMEDIIKPPASSEHDVSSAASYECEKCGSVYSHRQSLWRHKQQCENNGTRKEPRV